MKASDMNFHIDFQSAEKDRSAYRASIPGLSVRLPGEHTCAAKDLSSTGISFVPPVELNFQAEQRILLDIFVAGRPYVQTLECVVVRAKHNITACAFRDLTRTQEIRLDKLVLETQKHLIARRKAEEAARNVELGTLPGNTTDEKSTEPIRLDD